MTATVSYLRTAVPRPPAPIPALAPMNVGAYLAAILKAANELLRNELEVVCFQADVVSQMPVLWIKDTPRTRALVEAGDASYDRSGSDEKGPFRIGCFPCGDVQVQWFERVPS